MRNSLCTNSALLLGALSATGGAAAQDITIAEREQALHYQAETLTDITGAVKELSEAQWNFRPVLRRLASGLLPSTSTGICTSQV